MTKGRCTDIEEDTRPVVGNALSLHGVHQAQHHRRRSGAEWRVECALAQLSMRNKEAAVSIVSRC